METLIEDLKKVMNSEIEDKDKYMQMLINGFLRERDTEQLKLCEVNHRRELLNQYIEFLNWDLPIEQELDLVDIEKFEAWLNAR